MKMKKSLAISMIILLMSLISYSAKSYDIEEKEKIQRILKFQDPSRPGELIVDNVFGSIEVKGSDGQEVQLLVHKTIKAGSRDRIQKAKQEVSLEITEDGNTIDLYVDGPFRCQNKRGQWKKWRNPGYQVHYKFEIKVPYKTDVYLKTVTDGNILVRNVEGEFEVKNVNGRVEMAEMAGSGEAHTVNGKVEVLFSQNPKSDCSFRTVNGTVEVTFCENLSADLRLKTFTGDAYSDFPFEYLPSKPVKEGRYKGKYIYKSDRFTGVRISRGGPEIKLDTLNGDILITKRKS